MFRPTVLFAMIDPFNLRYTRKVMATDDFTIDGLPCEHRVDPVGFDVNEGLSATLSIKLGREKMNLSLTYNHGVYQR